MNFEYCQAINGTLVIPEGVEHIGAKAFAYWHRLSRIRFPSTLRSIGFMAFADSFNLLDLKLNDGLQTISSHAFHNSSEFISEIVIPESVETIGASAFYGSRRLDRLVLPSSLRTLETWSFEGNKVREIVWPACLEAMETRSIDAFRGIDLVLPEGLKTMGEHVMEDVANVFRIVLPLSLYKVGANVFFKVPNLKVMYAKNPEPPILPANVVQGEYTGWFSDIPSDALLYVPVGSAAAYRESPMFGRFAAIVETDVFPSSVEELEALPSSVSSGIYTLGGQYVGTDLNALGSGVYVVNGRKVVK